MEWTIPSSPLFVKGREGTLVAILRVSFEGFQVSPKARVSEEFGKIVTSAISEGGKASMTS